MNGYRIAVISGKGGAGKTTISANLARYMESVFPEVGFYDCDVEEPNGFLFLQPDIRRIEKVYEKLPVIDGQKCDGCGLCVQKCRFNALVKIGKQILIFDELCHDCGVCGFVCPKSAIGERQSEMGEISEGKSCGINCFEGKIAVSNIKTPLLISAVKERISDESVNVLDCPPGTTCSAVEALEGVDLCILAAEPTPFGFHDFKATWQMIEDMGLKSAVVINKYSGDDRLEEFCRKKSIEVLGRIDEDRKIAEICSEGRLLVDAGEDYRKIFEDMFLKIKDIYEAAGDNQR